MPNKNKLSGSKSINLITDTVKYEVKNQIRKAEYSKEVIGNVAEVKSDGVYVYLNAIEQIKINESGPFRNLSGQLLMNGDKVTLHLINGSLTNAYISQKISDNNDNHTTYMVNEKNLDFQSIASSHLKSDIITSQHIANKTSVCPKADSTTMSDLYNVTIDNSNISRIFYGMCIQVTPDKSSTLPVVINIILNGHRCTYVVNTAFEAGSTYTLVCTTYSANENILEFNVGSGTPLFTGSAVKQDDWNYYNIRCDDIYQENVFSGMAFNTPVNAKSNNNIMLGVNNLGAYELHDYYDEKVNDLVVNPIYHIGFNINEDTNSKNFIL